MYTKYVLFVLVTYSPLILATYADQDSLKSSLRQEHHDGYDEFEGNITLQNLVKKKYGVSIPELLDLFSSDTKKEDVSPWVPDVKGLPEWETQLLLHLINDEIKKSQKELLVTPATFVDDRRGYMEFNFEAFLKKKDEMVCRDTRRTAANRLLRYTKLEDDHGENTTVTLLWPLYPALNNTQIYCYAKDTKLGNKTYSKTIPIEFQTIIHGNNTPDDNGPWVSPNDGGVIKYNDTTPVLLSCWAWLYRYNFISWIQKGGELRSNITARLMSVIQRNKYSYLKLDLSVLFDSADNGSEIYCTRENGKIYTSEPTLLIYEGHTETLGLWCGLSVVWMVIAILVVSCGCGLAVVAIKQRRCSDN